MQNLKFALGIFCLCYLCLISCNDPSLIGSELLDEDQIDLKFSDDFTIEAKSVYNDSLIVLDLDVVPSIQLIDYQFGKIEDPIFGKYSSDLYMEFERVAALVNPNFSDSGEILDSVVLILPINPDNAYGNAFGAPFELEISKIASPFDPTKILYSDSEVVTSEVVGTYMFTPSSDSIDFAEPSVVDSFRMLPPQIRIPIPSSLAEDLFNAPDSTFTSSDKLQSFFPGLHLRAIGNTNGMLGLPINSGGELRFYHHNDTVFTTYFFPVLSASVKGTTFKHDFFWLCC